MAVPAFNVEIIFKYFIAFSLLLCGNALDLFSGNRINLRDFCEEENSVESLSVTCSNVTLDWKLNNIFEVQNQIAAQNVTFQNSDLPILPGAIFLVFPFVVNFVANECNIKFLYKYSFDEANNLEKLDLSFNYIEELREEVFYFTPKLEYLDLSYNHIKDIDSDAFIGAPKLKILRLSYNKIKTLSKWLQPLPNLKEIDLNNNQIESIIDSQTFQNNVELMEIKLFKNNVKNISGNAFNHLYKLLILDLSYNKFTEFHSKSQVILDLEFTPLEFCRIDGSVNELSIGNSNLSEILMSDSSKTEYLYLAESPLLNFDFIKKFTNLEFLKLDVRDSEKLTREFFGGLKNVTYFKLRLFNTANFNFKLFELMPKLRVLDISECNFDDDDDSVERNGDEIKELTKLKNLETLIINDADLLSYDRRGFRIMFPNLKIVIINNLTLECSYLVKMVKYLKQLAFKYSLVVEVNGYSLNYSVYDMGCVQILQNKSNFH